MSKLRVAIVFGGESSEHSVSCVTALGVLGAIDKSKYEVIAVGITKSGKFVASEINPDWKLSDSPEVVDGDEIIWPLGSTSKNRELRINRGGVISSFGTVDLVFPVLHGPNGEDGSFQSLMQLCHIPYVGNGILASAAAMDKVYAKGLFRNSGIKVAKDFVVSREAWSKQSHQELIASITSTIELPVFVKPSRSGSSVGVTLVKKREDLPAAIELALSLDRNALVEERIVGREVECSVLEDPSSPDGLRVSLAGEIVVSGRDFYDYEAKYLDAGAELIVPTELSDSELAEMHRLAKAAFRAVGCSSLARTDFFLTKSGFVLTEINTMPGFTPISMYPKLWQVSGISYPELIERLTQLGVAAGTEPR